MAWVVIAEQALSLLLLGGVFQQPEGDALFNRQVMVRLSSGHLFVEESDVGYLERVFVVDEPEYLDELVEFVFVPEGAGEGGVLVGLLAQVIQGGDDADEGSPHLVWEDADQVVVLPPQVFLVDGVPFPLPPFEAQVLLSLILFRVAHL